MVIFWSCKKAVFYKSKIERETGFYEGVGPDLQVEIIFYMAEPKKAEFGEVVGPDISTCA